MQSRKIDQEDRYQGCEELRVYRRLLGALQVEVDDRESD